VSFIFHLCRVAEQKPVANLFPINLWDGCDQNPLIIGGITNALGEGWVDCFHGLIDEVRLYNRSLSDTEVPALSRANSGKPKINRQKIS
jgi:hypothetical protein